MPWWTTPPLTIQNYPSDRRLHPFPRLHRRLVGLGLGLSSTAPLGKPVSVEVAAKWGGAEPVPLLTSIALVSCASTYNDPKLPQ
jgi:hypothetical protein